MSQRIFAVRIVFVLQDARVDFPRILWFKDLAGYRQSSRSRVTPVCGTRESDHISLQCGELFFGDWIRRTVRYHLADGLLGDRVTREILQAADCTRARIRVIQALDGHLSACE